MDDLQGKLILYGALVVAVVLHEVSHGVVALAFGDDTAKRAGRITLNPIPHVDPVGSVLLPAMAVLSGLPVLGWAKPVPVNPNRLREPRRQMLWVGLAGPATNFTLMLGAAFVVRFLIRADSFGLAFDVFWSLALVNLFLGIFNMLPIPPLDGSSILERLLPRRHLQSWYRFRPYGFLVLFGLLFFTDVFGQIMDPFVDQLFEFVQT